MPVQVSLRDNLYFIDSQGILDWPDQVTKLKLAALKVVCYPLSLLLISNDHLMAVFDVYCRVTVIVESGLTVI